MLFPCRRSLARFTRAICSASVAMGIAWASLSSRGADPPVPSDKVDPRWPAAKAWAWYGEQPWLVGCNFVPSSAVNDVEMWQKESFDAETIDRELGWAHDLGFNSVRVFLNYAVWEADAAGLKQRLDHFLSIAAKHEIKVMPILFDDCFKPEPKVGSQEAPEPGVHNSQWVASPGESRVRNPQAWSQLEKYVKDLVSTFGQDRRIVFWDLYNEPTRSLELVEAAFRWAREAKPSQPLTTCLYGPPPMRQRIAELSDIVSFHNYGPLPGLKAEVARLLAEGRPVVCTEWMARTGGSRFETHLPFFKENKIGCWNWGLVAGRTQTYFPWGSPKGAPEPALWFHDILRRNGEPCSELETRFIKGVTGLQPPLLWKPLVATSEQTPQTWRYRLEKPPEDWFKPGFRDADWPQGPAPFGREEPEYARHPGTIWGGTDIWLRREFDWPGGRFERIAVRLQHDDDAEVYLNGVPAVNAPGYNAAYEQVPIDPKAAATLKPGRNLMAIHVRQATGGQYIDAGLSGLVVVFSP